MYFSVFLCISGAGKINVFKSCLYKIQFLFHLLLQGKPAYITHICFHVNIKYEDQKLTVVIGHS